MQLLFATKWTFYPGLQNWDSLYSTGSDGSSSTGPSHHLAEESTCSLQVDEQVRKVKGLGAIHAQYSYPKFTF